MFELDHVWIASSPGAPEADALVDAGLVEGSANTHPGQGTANRRFFFDNAYLEWLFLVDEREAASVARTALLQRLRRDGGTCPFGICLRPTAAVTERAPFPSWEYAPRYLPAGMSIPIAFASEDPCNPMLFVVPASSRREPANRARIAQVTLHTPVPLEGLNDVVNVVPASAWAMDLSLQGWPTRLDIVVGNVRLHAPG